MEEQDYLYDAFISYRHLPLDKAVAKRLQDLLESYRPPKGLGNARIQRVFRDQTELPTSGDLGADITEALLHSHYLIVICSDETKNSIWCMEEIRQFRALHHGRNDHILAVLVQGEPHEVFPEELMYESLFVPQPDGTMREERRQIEPLSADVRAGSIRQSLRLLNTEFLRVAAPILGCGFDDLYRRHERRRKKRFALLAGSGTSMLAAVLAVISVFAWRTYLSEKNYQSTLADSYTRQGIASAEDGDLQDALLYYASALSLEPEEQDAAVMGAALLLEQNIWPYVDEEASGQIFDGRIFSDETLPIIQYCLAADSTGAHFLESTLDGYLIVGSDGSMQSLDAELGTWLDATEDGAYWIFCGEEELYFYETETGAVSALPRPSDISPNCSEDDYSLTTWPAAFPTQNGGAVVVYGGYVYLYRQEEDGWQQAALVNLGDVFPSEAGDLDVAGSLWLSGDGSLAVIASGFGIAAFDTADLTLKAMMTGGYHYLLNDVAFSADGSYFALIYGNSFGLSYNDPGGYLEVYDQNGQLCFATEEDLETAYEGAVFDPENPSRLLVWSNTCLQLWDIDAQGLYAVPVNGDWIEQAAFDTDGRFAAVDGEGNLTFYGMVSFSAADTSQESAADAASDSCNEAEEVEIDGMLQAYRISEETVLAISALRVWLLDENGNEQDRIQLDTTISDMMYDSETSAVYLYREYSTDLYMVRLSEDRTAFGEIIALNTRGGLVQSLCLMDGRLTVLTGSNQILLYSPGATEPETVIQLEHGGVVQELWETAGGYMAAYIQTNQSSNDSYHLDTEETVELWDLEAGLHIADLDPDETYLADQQLPTPDDETIAFLLALTSSSFDSFQNIVAGQPSFQPDTLGAWAGAVTAKYAEENAAAEEETEDRSRTETAQAEAEQTVGSEETLPTLDQFLAEYQDGPTEDGVSTWFAACDEIWLQLCDGEIEYTADTLDEWFCLYRDEADEHEYLGSLQTGVESYLAINTEGILLDDMAFSEFDQNLMVLMTITTLYDETIAEGFGRIADTLEPAIEEQTDLDAMTEMAYTYEIWWMRCFQKLLQGAGTESFDGLETEAADVISALFSEILGDTSLYSADDFNSLTQLYMEELYVAKLLVQGETADAADLTANCMQRMADQGTESDDILYYQKNYQIHYYVLAKRNILPQDCLNQYLELLPVDCGIRISGLSTDAQQLGLMLDDLIVAANDTYFSCLQQALDVLGVQSEVTFRILRDGQIVYIEKSASADYYGYFEMTFRETIAD